MEEIELDTEKKPMGAKPKRGRIKHESITVSQLVDRKAYMREYQRLYRKAHPEYYNNLYRKKKSNIS